MTVEQKLETLYNAVNEAWKYAFDGWEWEQNEKIQNSLCWVKKQQKMVSDFILLVAETLMAAGFGLSMNLKKTW